MKRLTASLLLAGALLVGANTAVLASPHEGNPGGNCDGYDGPGKTDTSDGSILLPEGTVVCVKAGDSNTGTMTVLAGGETLAQLIERSGLLNNGGQVPGVSNYVVYTTPPPTTPPPTTPPPTTPPPTDPPTTEPPTDKPTRDCVSDPQLPRCDVPTNDPPENLAETGFDAGGAAAAAGALLALGLASTWIARRWGGEEHG